MKRCHTRRGVTLIELLVAALILSFVAATAASSWSISSQMPATLRTTELASKIAVREIERVKAQRYMNIAAGPTTTTTYYDKSGAATDSAQNSAYLATTTTKTVPVMPMPDLPTTRDLVEVVCTVTKNNDTNKVYETQRTLLAFGAF